MRVSFTELATPGVRNLQPYVPGKPVAGLEREHGADHEGAPDRSR